MIPQQPTPAALGKKRSIYITEIKCYKIIKVLNTVKIPIANAIAFI